MSLPSTEIPTHDGTPELVLSCHGMELGRYPVRRRILTLGRAPDNDVVLDHHGVSRYHAQIITVQGESVVEDLGSRNGTFVNNSLVKVRALRFGDEIVIAGYRLRMGLREPGGAVAGEGGARRDVSTLLRRWGRGIPLESATSPARCTRCGALSTP